MYDYKPVLWTFFSSVLTDLLSAGLVLEVIRLVIR